MRNAGVAKMGFYPTPEESLERILDLLAPLSGGLFGKAALDPCAGEGEALRRACERLGLRPHAIELDEERAKRAKKALAPLGGKVLQGNAFDHEARGFAFLWLNPPYDWGEEGRLEEEWVRAFLPALVPGGVLVLVVPEREVARLWPRLVAAGKVRLAARLTRGDYPAFKQAVVVLERGLPTREPPPEDLPYLEEAVLEGPPFAPKWALAHLAPREKEEPLEVFLERARTSPLWERVEGGGSLGGFRPLVPMKPAHLALLVAGGLMDLEEVEIGGDPHLIVGVLRKDEVEVEDEEEGKRVVSEVFRMGIRALNLRTGELLEVE